jgi:hypothetical protein
MGWPWRSASSEAIATQPCERGQLDELPPIIGDMGDQPTQPGPRYQFTGAADQFAKPPIGIQHQPKVGSKIHPP